MTPTEQLTDAEINKLMNEHDDGLCPRPYATCIDAAVGWIERRGFAWVRVNDSDGRFYVLVWRASNFQCYGETVYESPDCPTSRALCNAGLAAWRKMGQAKEAKK